VARSASTYLYDLGTIQPFLAGNDITLQEFAVETGTQEQPELAMGATPSIASDSMAPLSQAEQSANLRAHHAGDGH